MQGYLQVHQKPHTGIPPHTQTWITNYFKGKKCSSTKQAGNTLFFSGLGRSNLYVPWNPADKLPDLDIFYRHWSLVIGRSLKKNCPCFCAGQVMSPHHLISISSGGMVASQNLTSATSSHTWKALSRDCLVRVGYQISRVIS